MGRPRKYTPKRLREAVDAYFLRYTRTVTLREQVNTGQKDSWGHWVYELRDVCNDADEPVKVREFTVPPTVGGLCRHLGIHRSTWADWCDREKYPEFAEVVGYAREVMQDYLETELLTRSGKELKGVIFSLQNNYGYTERKEVELGPKARRTVAAGVSMAEREALLKELAAEFGQETEGPPPEPSEAGLVGRGGARERGEEWP